jgi:transcriptional regulator with XRE-family HTH domain
MALSFRTNRLRETRKAQKVSGYDLQLLSNVRAQKIYLIERGLTRASSYEKFAIAGALGRPVEEIFPRELSRSREIV